MATINKELWTSTLAENLFMNNPFMKTLTDHSEFIHYSQVNVPQAGSNPAVVRNRGGLTTQATPYQRNDTILSYPIVQYTTDPILLTDLEVNYLSYDKRLSVLSQHQRNLEQVIGNFTCLAIAPSSSTTGKVIRTTGALSTAALSSGATGSRSAVTLSDFARLKNMFDTDNIPEEGRYAVVPAPIYNTQLLSIDEIKQAQMYGSPNLPSGVVNQIYGINILVRPTTVSYSTGSTTTLLGFTDAGQLSGTTVNDNLAIIAYHPDFVSHAKGSVKLYDQIDAPLNYGSLFSMGVFHGAAKVYAGSIGTYAIVQQ